MQDFSCFLDHLKQRLDEGLLDQVAQLKVYMLDDVTPENIAALLQEYANDLLAASNKSTLRILQTYHEWLQSSSQ